MVLWLDEMGVGSDAAAGRSWAPVGQTPVIKGTGKRFRVNMISAINPYVIPYALGVRTPGLAGRAHRCWSVPLRGASQPQKPRLTGPPQGEWSGQAERCASRD